MDKNELTRVIASNIYHLLRKNNEETFPKIDQYRKDMVSTYNITHEEFQNCYDLALKELNKAKDFEKQLKLLAKDLVWVTDKLNNDDGRMNELDREELRDEQNRINRELLKLGYSYNSIEIYMDEYRQLRIGEYQKWLNGEL